MQTRMTCIHLIGERQCTFTRKRSIFNIHLWCLQHKKHFLFQSLPLSFSSTYYQTPATPVLALISFNTLDCITDITNHCLQTSTMSYNEQQKISLGSDAYMPMISYSFRETRNEEESIQAPDSGNGELFPTLRIRLTNNTEKETKNPKSLYQKVPAIDLRALSTVVDQKEAETRREAIGKQSSIRQHRGYNIVKEENGPRTVVPRKDPAARPKLA